MSEIRRNSTMGSKSPSLKNLGTPERKQMRRNSVTTLLPQATPGETSNKGSATSTLDALLPFSAKKNKIAKIKERRATLMSSEKMDPSKFESPAMKEKMLMTPQSTPREYGEGRNTPSSSRTSIMKERAFQLRQERENQKLLFITGFGSFGDVNLNPTEQIIQHLRNEDFSVPGFVSQFDILHVSTGAVDDYLEDRFIRGKVKGFNVNVHLGVASKNTRFHLEQYCYNNKDFRIPAMDGKQPQKEKIDPDTPFDEAAPTSFNLMGVCKKLKERGFDVSVSTDPGRYLCNYIYFQSFRQQADVLGVNIGGDYDDTTISEDFGDFDSSSTTGKNKTVFIHVPPFEIIDKRTQFEFIRACIRMLCAEDACDRPPGMLPTVNNSKACDTACVVDTLIPSCQQS